MVNALRAGRPLNWSELARLIAFDKVLEYGGLFAPGYRGALFSRSAHRNGKRSKLSYLRGRPAGRSSGGTFLSSDEVKLAWESGFPGALRHPAAPMDIAPRPDSER